MSLRSYSTASDLQMDLIDFELESASNLHLYCIYYLFISPSSMSMREVGFCIYKWMK